MKVPNYYGRSFARCMGSPAVQCTFEWPNICDTLKCCQGCVCMSRHCNCMVILSRWQKITEVIPVEECYGWLVAILRSEHLMNTPSQGDPFRVPNCRPRQKRPAHAPDTLLSHILSCVCDIYHMCGLHSACKYCVLCLNLKRS